MQLGFFIDYRRLQQATVADTYPLSRLDDCIYSLGDASVFSTLDSNFGYWKVAVAEKYKDET